MGTLLAHYGKPTSLGDGMPPGQMAVSEKLTAAEARAAMEEAERLIDAIEPRTVANLRDRAIIGMMGYAWASVETVLAMRVRDYYPLGDRGWVRLIERGTERYEIVARRLQRHLEDYLAAAQIQGEPRTPLFRSTLSGNRRIGPRPVRCGYVITLIKHLNEVSDRRLSNHDGETSGRPYNITSTIIESVTQRSIVNLRDRAILGMMLYTSAFPEELSTMRVRDYYSRGGEHWIGFSQRAPMQAVQPLVALMRDYQTAARRGKNATAPLFRKGRSYPIMPSDIRKMIRRRDRASKKQAIAARL